MGRIVNFETAQKLLTEYEQRFGHKPVCIALDKKKGSPEERQFIFLARLQKKPAKNGDEKFVFARLDVTPDQLRTICSDIKVVRRNVPKQKAGYIEFNKFIGLLTGQRKAAPAYIIKKIMFARKPPSRSKKHVSKGTWNDAQRAEALAKLIGGGA